MTIMTWHAIGGQPTGHVSCMSADSDGICGLIAGNVNRRRLVDRQVRISIVVAVTGVARFRSPWVFVALQATLIAQTSRVIIPVTCLAHIQRKQMVAQIAGVIFHEGLAERMVGLQIDIDLAVDVQRGVDNVIIGVHNTSVAQVT